MEKQPSLCGEPLENASLSLVWKGLPPRERFFPDVPGKERTTNKPITTNKHMLAIGKEFNLLAGMMDFSQESSPNEYFSEKENRENAKIIFFQKD